MQRIVPRALAPACLALQAAVEAFAAENGGRYPRDLEDTTYGEGHTVIDLLPGGERLVNPYTGLATVPTEGYAVNPGETGFVPYYIRTLEAVGYRITGFGETGRAASLSNFPEGLFYFDDAMLDDAFSVRDAAEAFAGENDGVHPADTGSDETPAGNTLIDLLPDGQRIMNVFTLANTEPVDGAAALPGEIGYSPAVAENGERVGYWITVHGTHGVILTMGREPPEEWAVRRNAYRLEKAVEDFAAANGGDYPDDVETDTTPAGDTVIDLLPGGVFLTNPYTGEASEPRNGPVRERGQIGYAPVRSGIVNRGYIISAWGTDGEVARLRREPE